MKSRSRNRRRRQRPPALIAPSGLKSWHCFAFLIVAAVIWHYLRGPLIGLGVLVVIFGVLGWLRHLEDRWRR